MYHAPTVLFQGEIFCLLVVSRLSVCSRYVLVESEVLLLVVCYQLLLVHAFEFSCWFTSWTLSGTYMQN